MSTDARRALGAHGELLARRHLERAGYRILERNFRTTFGELDIVAADSRAIVFCEVKTRLGDGRRRTIVPLDSVGQRKRRRVRAMASEWLRERPPGPDRPHRADLRFDAIGVTIAPNGALLALEHVRDAF